MSGRMSRNKGASFEREFAALMKHMGWPEAKRGIGQTRSGSEVCDVEGTPWWIECKRHKRCNIQAAYKQAELATDGRDIMAVTRDDYGPVLITMRADNLLGLIAYLKGVEK